MKGSQIFEIFLGMGWVDGGGYLYKIQRFSIFNCYNLLHITIYAVHFEPFEVSKLQNFLQPWWIMLVHFVPFGVSKFPNFLQPCG